MLKLSLLLPFVLLVAACKPSEEAVQARENAQKIAPGAIPLPPEIIEKSGLGVKDQRAEIVFLQGDSKLPFHEFQKNGLVMLVSSQAGYKLTLLDAENKAALQTKQFQDAMAAKPAAIFVSPVDPPSLAALVVEAQTAGILVIGLEKRMATLGCTSVVFSDQKKVGQMAAQTAIAALGRKSAEAGQKETTGRIIEIRGDETSVVSDELAEGFAEELKKTPGAILVHDAPADWNSENAEQRTQEALRLQKQFDVIFAHNDALALGAAKAAATAGIRENVFIIGTDGIAGQKRGIDLVRDGELDATVVQPALVDLGLQIVLKMRKDKSFKPQPAYQVEPVVIIPKNVEQALQTGTYKLPQL